MTERIKELKQQAEDYVDSIDDGLSIEHYRQFVDLKFAELLIKETTNVIIIGHKGHMNPALATDSVKQHFGVEE